MGKHLYDYARILADYLSSLRERGSFVIREDPVYTEHMRKDHIGIDLADAVLQRQADWYKTVKPRLDRIQSSFPSARTMSGLREVLRSTSESEFLDWRESGKARGLVPCASLSGVS